jgi:copper chaperone CopZ
MKKATFLALSLTAVVGCTQSGQTPATVETTEEKPAAVTQTAFNTEGAPTVEFSVPDMVCEFSCVPEVRETLAKQPGVKDVKVVLDTHTATVAVDTEKFDAEKAIAALVDRHFTNTKLASASSAAEDSKVEADPAAPAAPEAPKS